MIRDKLRVILNTKAFYIIFSIVASIALWSYVTYVQNPDQTLTVGSIPVEFVGQDKLQETGLVVTNVSTENVTLKFTGKRNTVTKLRSDNVKLSVDLSEISALSNGITGVYQLTYDITYPTGTNLSFVTVSDASDDIFPSRLKKWSRKVSR